MHIRIILKLFEKYKRSGVAFFLQNSRHASNEQSCLKTTGLYDDLLLSNLFHFFYFISSAPISFCLCSSISPFLTGVICHLRNFPICLCNLGAHTIPSFGQISSLLTCSRNRSGVETTSYHSYSSTLHNHHSISSEVPPTPSICHFWAWGIFRIHHIFCSSLICILAYGSLFQP